MNVNKETLIIALCLIGTVYTVPLVWFGARRLRRWLRRSYGSYALPAPHPPLVRAGLGGSGYTSTPATDQINAMYYRALQPQRASDSGDSLMTALAEQPAEPPAEPLILNGIDRTLLSQMGIDA